MSRHLGNRTCISLDDLHSLIADLRQWFPGRQNASQQSNMKGIRPMQWPNSGVTHLAREHFHGFRLIEADNVKVESLKFEL